MADPITSSSKGFDKTIKDLDDRIKNSYPMAIAKAITKTASKARTEVKAEMKKVFDRPTPYTLSSVGIEMATPQKLSARVYIKNQATTGNAPAKFLSPEIFGGQRGQKTFEKRLAKVGVIRPDEYLVPMYAKLDRYGNVSRGLTQKVLSGVQAQFDDYQNSPRAGEGYRGTRSRRKVANRYYAIRKDNYTLIFERTAKHVTPLFISRKHLNYKKRLHFHYIIKKSVKKNLHRELRSATRKYIKITNFLRGTKET